MHLTDLGRLTAFSLLFVLLGHGLQLGKLIGPPRVATDLQPALDRVQDDFHRDLDSLLRVSARYATATHRRPAAATLRTLHLRTRQQFKRCAYLLEYLEPETVKRYLNGAPLPKTEPRVPEVIVVEPLGLQVLDELVFADSLDYAAVRAVADQLHHTLRQLLPYLARRPLQHRYVFEASREEAIRLFTLGVTGFDTPGSVAAMPEAATALRQLHLTYGYYSAAVRRADTATDAALLAGFRHGLARLEGASFADFDRLAFLRETINPLTELLPRAQALLGIESAADDRRLRQAVNPRAASIFSPDFLNAAYYSRLGASPYAEQRRALGERLFFDPILSEQGTLSCASCHRPELAFTDGNAKSVRRNAPTLLNSVFAERYFYDLREPFLERQVRHVVMDAHEFATDFVAINERLRNDETYVRLFSTAYADQPAYALGAWSVSDALTHYVSSLRSFDSAFDRYARGATATIDPAVRRGFNLFMGKAACGSCHFPPTFSGLVPPQYRESESEVLGVPERARWAGARLDPDPGRAASGRPQDEAYFHAYAFKTPTVRNVAVTAPYMHNGVYRTLDEVVDFYDRGGGRGIGIDLPHQTLPFDRLDLTAGERRDLIVFMEALTDYPATGSD